MINLEIRASGIQGLCYEPLTVGSKNSIFLKCSFAPEWNALNRIAVFSNGDTSVSVSMDDDIFAIPHEVLSSPGELIVSFRGIGDGGKVVLCTADKNLGKIVSSHASMPSVSAEAATPDVFDALLADVAALKANGAGGGAAGKSAYEIAQDNGFEGTIQEWLASLHGADGRNGTNGNDGRDGEDGTDGYTPVKGVDYFTAADIAEITAAVNLTGLASESYVDLAIQTAISAVDVLIGSGVIE